MRRTAVEVTLIGGNGTAAKILKIIRGIPQTRNKYSVESRAGAHRILVSACCKWHCAGQQVKLVVFLRIKTKGKVKSQF